MLALPVVASRPGYNTATHSQADGNDPYALDIVRIDAPTAGTQVVAPMDGRVGFASDSCLSINDAQQVSLLICHVFPVAGLRGKNVVRGQVIATVAPAGQANNNGLAHLHLGLSGTNRAPLPFTGAYAIEGVELLPTTWSNWHAGVEFLSTNVIRLAVDAGADRMVVPGATVTLTADGASPSGEPVRFVWSQISGPPVQLSQNGATITFIAPIVSGVTLQFGVVGSVSSMTPVTDTVTVNVIGTATRTPTPTRTPTATASRTPAGSPTPTAIARGVTQTGAFVNTPVFSTTGQSLAVFAGGTVAELETAVSALNARGAWAQDASGGFQLLVVGAPSFLKDAFTAKFPTGFAGPTAMTLVK